MHSCMVPPTVFSNFTSSLSIFCTNTIFCIDRLLKRTQIPAAIKIKQSKDVPVFSANLRGPSVHPAVQHGCATVLQDIPGVFRAVAGLGTGVGEEQMHHPLLLPLLWGQISWGWWGGRRATSWTGTAEIPKVLNLCFGWLECYRFFSVTRILR